MNENAVYRVLLLYLVRNRRIVYHSVWYTISYTVFVCTARRIIAPDVWKIQTQTFYLFFIFSIFSFYFVLLLLFIFYTATFIWRVLENGGGKKYTILKIDTIPKGERKEKKKKKTRLGMRELLRRFFVRLLDWSDELRVFFSFSKTVARYVILLPYVCKSFDKKRER